MKIRPLGTELFLADRRADRQKLIDALRNFANAPKSGAHFYESRHLIMLPWPCGQNLAGKYEGKLLCG
jgi:hypothetical protein